MKKSAFELQARTWREKVLSISRHYGADKDEAEDIAQDVMLRLWQMHEELERFQSIEAIVTLMAKHLLRNRQRRRSTETLDAAPSSISLPTANGASYACSTSRR